MSFYYVDWFHEFFLILLLHAVFFWGDFLQMMYFIFFPDDTEVTNILKDKTLLSGILNDIDCLAK